MLMMRNEVFGYADFVYKICSSERLEISEQLIHIWGHFHARVAIDIPH